MKLISCALTQPQILDESKTETRRLSWKNVKSGDRLCFVDRVMGFKKGQKPKRLKIVEVVKAWRERLCEINQEQVVCEGFPDMSPSEFVDMFCKNMKCQPETEVTVIQFKYVAQDALSKSY